LAGLSGSIRPAVLMGGSPRAGRSFDDLVDEADHAPIHGWDFSWLDGRAEEERPSWGYHRLLASRVARASVVIDLQSGGGELVAGLPDRPQLLVATEGWAPNVAIAARRLQPLGAHVVATRDDRPDLPFRSGAADLVSSRHPITTWWAEIARVLRHGGTFLSQQVGPHSVGELTEFFLGPQPATSKRDPAVARAGAEAAGLQVLDLRTERLRTVFHDVGAVVYFLRLVVWIVPRFSVDAYRDRLARLHDQIEDGGPFVAHATRFLIEARKAPAP
jgi:SAM-dependent methyltransferase